MEILFEDKDIVVAVKPAGVLSQGDGASRRSFADDIGDYLKEKGETGGVFVVHRLDRAVGGVMVYAKTRYAASALSGQTASGNFKKTYEAVVHGVPESREGVFEDLLFKDSRKNKSFVVDKMRKGVKPAKLSYELLDERESKYGKVSLVGIRLYTGRTHQIRVQFSSRKMPLVGDGKYGGRDNCGIGLWSYSVSFLHPESGERLKFERKPEKEPFDIFLL